MQGHSCSKLQALRPGEPGEKRTGTSSWRSLRLQVQVLKYCTSVRTLPKKSVDDGEIETLPVQIVLGAFQRPLSALGGAQSRCGASSLFDHGARPRPPQGSARPFWKPRSGAVFNYRVLGLALLSRVDDIHSVIECHEDAMVSKSPLGAPQFPVFFLWRVIVWEDVVRRVQRIYKSKGRRGENRGAVWVDWHCLLRSQPFLVVDCVWISLYIHT